MPWYVFNVLFVCQVVCQDVGGIECVCRRRYKDSQVGVCIRVMAQRQSGRSVYTGDGTKTVR